MAKTNIQNGQIVVANFFNAVNNPQFTVDEGGEEFDGIHYRIRDTSLSNDATQIKTRFTTFENELRVSHVSGLNFSYTGGRVILADRSIATIAPATVSVPNNTSNVFIYVTELGAIAASTTPPVRRLDLARVNTSGGTLSGAIVDLRPRFAITPRQDAVKVLGGSGEQGAKSITGAETLTDGEYWYSSLTITSTGILTIPASCRIYVTGNVLIQGTINVTPNVSGGSGPLQTRIETYQIGGTGPGAGIGRVGGAAYNYSLSPSGSGGASGQAVAASTATIAGWSVNIPGGGLGGGSLYIEAGGSITVQGGTITAQGGDATAGNVTSNTNLGRVTGGGGGSGGSVFLKSLSAITITSSPLSTINVRGGNGSNALFTSGGGSGLVALGGGGGGGGQIILMAPSVTSAGSTLNTSGGTGGTALGGASQSGRTGGGGGGFGGAGGNGGAAEDGVVSGGSVSASGGAGQVVVRTFKAVN